jgi:hypothetical protein
MSDDQPSPERWVELDDYTIDIENPEPRPFFDKPSASHRSQTDILMLRRQSIAHEKATEELLWCLQHRSVCLTRPGISTTSPDGFGVPSVPVRPSRLTFYDRHDAQTFLKEFVEETLKRAISDPRCDELSACKVVHPGGEFYRNGPYLWARIQNNRYVLIEINLWPQLKSDEGCCPRLFDLIQRLGVVTMTDSSRLIDQADDFLGPNVYPGICNCDAW